MGSRWRYQVGIRNNGAMAWERIVILALPVLLSTTSMAAAEPGSAAVTALGNLVPIHHSFRTFEGSVTWYKPQPDLLERRGSPGGPVGPEELLRARRPAQEDQAQQRTALPLLTSRGVKRPAKLCPANSATRAQNAAGSS